MGGRVSDPRFNVKGAGAQAQGYRIWPKIVLAKVSDHPAQNGVVFRAVILSVAGSVRVERHVRHPVQPVLD